MNLDAGKPKEAAELYEALTWQSEKLSHAERAEAMLRYGEAKLKSGDPDGALGPLNEAADLAPDSPRPRSTSSARSTSRRRTGEEVVRIKTRRLDVVSGSDERSALLLEIGDVLANQINDRTRAAKSFVAALDERPDDRKILTKLMQLYSEEKDWSKLVEIVLKLASKVDDARQKAKYLHTAAIVTWRQMGDLEGAGAFYDQVLELDPTLDKALAEAIEIRRDRGDHEGVERYLKVELERATDNGDTAKMLETFEKLGALYKDKLGWTSEAIDAYEAAQTLDPDNQARSEQLATMYASDPAQYLDKAVAAQVPILKRSPYKPEPYRLLRKLYTEAKRADAAWSPSCQALFCLNTAEPDEPSSGECARRRRRQRGIRLSDDDLGSLARMHFDADPLLTQIFAAIEPAVLPQERPTARDARLPDGLRARPRAAPVPDVADHLLRVRRPRARAAADVPEPERRQRAAFLHAHTPAISARRGGAPDRDPDSRPRRSSPRATSRTTARASTSGTSSRPAPASAPGSSPRSSSSPRPSP